MIEWFLWITGLTISTATGVVIYKKFKENAYTILTGIYVTYLLASQILAVKIVELNFFITTLIVPAAVFLYPFTAQVIDMINEVFGRKKTHLAIFTAFISNVLLVICIYLVNTLTPASFWNISDWEEIFGLSIRITMASWISFLICQNLDAWIFGKLKQKFYQQTWIRSLFSDAGNLILDSIIFVTIAFYGVMPIIPLITGQIISKVLIGWLDTPWFLWYKKQIGDTKNVI